MNTTKQQTATDGIYWPQRLKLWEMPEHYAGPVHPATYVFLMVARDSDNVTRSNFDVALQHLGGPSDTVEVVKERHWAFGWLKWISIHQDDSHALMLADEMLRQLEGYPLLDDYHYSELEYEDSVKGA